jgi:RNA polymerase sigma-70 factor (ECF subfamily)
MSSPRRLSSSRQARFDARDLDELIVSSTPRLYRLAVRLTGNLQDAEDVLQEAYLQAVRMLKAHMFLGRSALETWLYRVVTNGALRALRRQGRVTDGVERAPPPFESRAQAEVRAELQVLASWLAELPEEQRAALVLKELEGLSTAEIAAVLQCSEGAVEQRLVRARGTLRGRYNDE